MRLDSLMPIIRSADIIKTKATAGKFISEPVSTHPCPAM